MILRTAVVSTVTLGLVMGSVSATAATAAAPPADSDLATSSPAQRNHISRTGNAAQWVQPPYLKTLKNGRIALKGTVYVDALVMTIATNTEAGRATLDTIRGIRSEFPKAHISLGLSNVSFGLPVRSLVNRTFLTLAVAAGMDTAIIDPNDRELKAALFATDLLLGNDKHCLNYTRAFRKGLLEAPKPAA